MKAIAKSRVYIPKNIDKGINDTKNRIIEEVKASNMKEEKIAINKCPAKILEANRKPKEIALAE